MSISERATNAAIKFGLIFIMMIILTIFQEVKVQKEEGEDPCCPSQEKTMLIKGEKVEESMIKLFQKNI